MVLLKKKKKPSKKRKERKRNRERMKCEMLAKTIQKKKISILSRADLLSHLIIIKPCGGGITLLTPIFIDEELFE